MSALGSKRLVAAVLVLLGFVSYIGMRDSVRVNAEVPTQAVKMIVSGVEEWSSPKLFRHIEIEPGPEGTLLGEVREPGGRWSVTVFTNQAGVWKRCGWYLVGEDKAGMVHRAI